MGSSMCEPIELLDAPRLLGPAPCDECRFRDRCGLELLACESYVLFVRESGPTRWGLAPRAPNRARYLALFDDKVGEPDRPAMHWLRGGF
jgi:hypothetical protein